MSGTKLTILIIAAAGVVAFAASFGLSRYFGVGPTEASGEDRDAAPTGADARPEPTPFQQATRLEDRHLHDLIKEVRRKLRECDERETDLTEEENRIAMVREDLHQEAQRLEDLRVKVAAAVTDLKQAQARLEASRVRIDAEEAANLRNVAAVYDRMKSDESCKIIEAMCRNDQETDAVKILHYMSERAVAKVLEDLSDKALAARLCDRMKRVRESEG